MRERAGDRYNLETTFKRSKWATEQRWILSVHRIRRLAYMRCFPNIRDLRPDSEHGRSRLLDRR